MVFACLLTRRVLVSLLNTASTSTRRALCPTHISPTSKCLPYNMLWFNPAPQTPANPRFPTFNLTSCFLPGTSYSASLYDQFQTTYRGFIQSTLASTLTSSWMLSAMVYASSFWGRTSFVLCMLLFVCWWEPSLWVFESWLGLGVLSHGVALVCKRCMRYQ